MFDDFVDEVIYRWTGLSGFGEILQASIRTSS